MNGGPEPDSTNQLRSARLRSQGLTEPSRSAIETVRRLLATQAQDPRGARLAIRARTTGLTANDVDHALTIDRSMVIGWLHRGTLHLVPSEDYWWLHALTAPRLATSNATRLRQEGVDEHHAERGVAIIAEALGEGDARTRGELRILLEAAGIPTAGQALVHLLFAASNAGHALRGPVVQRAGSTATEQAFVDPALWIGPRPDIDIATAEKWLAERYLVGHGPADAKDLVKWTGMALGAARRAFAALDPAGPDRDVTASPSPRLLGPFDPILHGWASREMFVGPHHGVVTSGGIFRPTALVNGHVVATWAIEPKGIRLRPLETIAPKDLAALKADAIDVQRFLCLPERGISTIEQI